MNRNLAIGLAALALAVPGAAPAQQATEDWQTIDVLTQMVANAMGRNASPIDRRIKLARCPEQASITAIDAHTLAVRCAPLGWRLRVPMSASVDPAAGNAFVPANSFAAKPAASTPVIRRGDIVRVSIETNSFAISYSATATQEGRVGDLIALRGSDAKSVLSAIVTGPGRARLAD